MPLNFLRSFLITLLFIANWSQASIDTGIQWMKIQQQADGRFYSSGTTSTPIQATAEAVKSLALTAPAPDPVTRSARDYIHGQPLDHLEDLHYWPAFAPSDVETKTELINLINRYSRANGGFGDYIGNEHSVLATVFALNSLRDLSAPNTASTQTAIQYLLNAQKSDGGWAEEGNYSSIYITALVSQLLQRYRLEFNVTNATAIATQFLLQQQKTGGGWETSLDSAQALLAIILNSTNASTYQVALEKLNAAQASNGSWYNDVFTTALALRALYLANNLPTITQPNAPTIVGILTANAAPVAAGSIEIQGINTQFNTDPNGRFELNTLPAGTYQLFYKALGFQTKSQVVTLPAATRLDLGAINLQPLNSVPAPSSVTGVLVGGTAKIPVAQGKVVIEGASSRTVTVDAAGRFTLDNLVPGSYQFSFRADGFIPYEQTITVPANTHVEVSNIVLSSNSNAAVVAGRITDAQNHATVPGVLVKITNGLGTTVTAQTDTAGNYSAEVVGGNTLSITIEHASFQKIETSTFAPVGTQVNFSPSLYALNANFPTQVNLSGIVLDAENKLPIAAVTIEVKGQALTATTQNDGLFNLAELPAGNIELIFAVPGYQTLRLNGTSVLGTMDVGSIYLQPISSLPTIITGRITDSLTGLPIAGARVGLGIHSAVTTADGQYQITQKELAQNESTLNVQASGYLGSELKLVLNRTGTVEINFPMQKAASQGISISDLTADKPKCGAYCTANFTGILKNIGDVSQDIITQVKVTNPAGNTIEEFMVATDATSFETPLNLTPQQQLTLPFAWHTQNYPPGVYTLHWSVFSKRTLQLLAQMEKTLTIEPTIKIASLKVVSSIDQTNQGTTAQLLIQAAVRNQSNVPAPVQISYDFIDPSGELIFTHTRSFTLDPLSVFSTVPLDNLAQIFSRSGEYFFTVKVLSDDRPDMTEGGSIRVAPNTRIEITQDIAPKKVIPVSNERVKVNIHLEGLEVQP